MKKFLAILGLLGLIYGTALYYIVPTIERISSVLIR